ncbi:uncharacterized protein THITE_2126780 [Thermothielavioides terrestris NRRL 8126]|uniref:Uncharacterized protein n=1 Tax=Thermothielavioides terrestris (strain ATCC 38088 / NRRL 8126) TaxID=578455 RepID=G2QTL3_THETT|nr:uncharacterized protein THITE_2126780 [Thermothielavioides terrestris NRRL 8126]AEO64432.1 hypothetical protein THITE_2126780 [Thermothielavioides terrestris NRRL 8126]
MSSLQRAIAHNSAQRFLQCQQEEEEEAREKARQAEEEWQRARWEAARRDMANGTFKRQPEIRIPVIITPNAPVPSTKDLQQLARMDSVPEALEATLIRAHGINLETPVTVTICLINREEKARLEEKANVEYNAIGKFIVRIGEQENPIFAPATLAQYATPEQEVQKRPWVDMMGAPFLWRVAAHNIDKSTLELLELWHFKASTRNEDDMRKGKVFQVHDDFKNAAWVPSG